MWKYLNLYYDPSTRSIQNKVLRPRAKPWNNVSLFFLCLSYFQGELFQLRLFKTRCWGRERILGNFFIFCLMYLFFSFLCNFSREIFKAEREIMENCLFFSILANFRGNFSNIQNKVLRPRVKPWRIYIFFFNVSFIVISVEKFSRLREKLWKAVSLFDLF